MTWPSSSWANFADRPTRLWNDKIRVSPALSIALIIAAGAVTIGSSSTPAVGRIRRGLAGSPDTTITW